MSLKEREEMGGEIDGGLVWNESGRDWRERLRLERDVSMAIFSRV